LVIAMTTFERVTATSAIVTLWLLAAFATGQWRRMLIDTAGAGLTVAVVAALARRRLSAHERKAPERDE